MTKQLTDNERTYMNQARTDLFDGVDLESIKPEIANSASFRSGFITGLSYNRAKLNKLIAFIRGEITRSEIEDILE